MTRRALPLMVLVAVLTGCGADGDGAMPAEGDVRWVGAGDVAVAVPAWWTTGETRCLKPVEDTVYAESGAMTDCALPEPTDAELAEVSSLAVMSTRSGLGEGLLRQMRPTGSVAGREVLELEGCADFWDAVCRRVFAVPSADVAFGVVSTDDAGAEGSYRAIRDSLRVLPDGTTPVPMTYGRFGDFPSYGAPPGVVERYGRRLEGVGLEVERVVAPLPGPGDGGSSIADLPPGSLLEIEPQPGTPVDRGSTVTLTVMPVTP